jgi:hypothetical protein
VRHAIPTPEYFITERETEAQNSSGICLGSSTGFDRRWADSRVGLSGADVCLELPSNLSLKERRYGYINKSLNCGLPIVHMRKLRPRGEARGSSLCSQ